MLVHLHVKNLALIDEIEVEFGPGLNILTGETGAGKSILLGSMQLILVRKDIQSMIREKCSLCAGWSFCSRVWSIRKQGGACRTGYLPGGRTGIDVPEDHGRQEHQ